jgi:hypothetical protein
MINLISEDERGALSSSGLVEGGLPGHFSWEKFVPEAVDQKNCGSCYAIATAHMLTSRLKIQVD